MKYLPQRRVQLQVQLPLISVSSACHSRCHLHNYRIFHSRAVLATKMARSQNGVRQESARSVRHK
ncbi:GD17770 [Drosophila simulans]|uniref:GD17770 n=1 Tax=Drosophila simulans TaxID=7240 RepID=B4QZL8_DROSI|nr:GD17770 [Drosophila simulans]